MGRKASLAAVGTSGTALKESIRGQKSEGFEKIGKSIESGDLPEGFFHPGKSRTANRRKAGDGSSGIGESFDRCDWAECEAEGEAWGTGGNVRLRGLTLFLEGINS